MFRFFRWSMGFVTLVGAMGLVVYIGLQVWTRLEPHRPSLSTLRQRAADALVPQVVEDLRLNKAKLQPLTLVHLVNDTSDYVSERLRTVIEGSGAANLLERPLPEQAEPLAGAKVTPVEGLDSALREAKARGAKGVLFGQVHQFAAQGGTGTCDLAISLADVDSGKVVFTRSYSNAVDGSALNPAAAGDHARPGREPSHWLSWAVIVLVLPVFTIAFIRAMVRKESNRSNAFVLGVYTAADALLGWLLLGANPLGWVSGLLFLGAVGVAFAYNVSVMTFALRMEQ